MKDPAFWVRIGGLLQLAILIGSALVSKVLSWSKALATLPVILRRMTWVYGLFIVFTIAGMGLITTLYPHSFVAGSGIGRAVAMFLAGFWGLRLIIQIWVFDMRIYLTHPVLTLGYHGLTAVFTYLVIIFSAAAIWHVPIATM